MAKLSNVDHRANLLLAALEPEAFACLEPHLELVDLAHKQVLYETDDMVGFAYFPHDAIISLVNVMENGTTTEVALFGREGLCGLLSTQVSHRSFGRFVVQMAGAASRISVERLNIGRDTCSGLRQLIRNYTEALLSQTFQTVSCNAVHSVEARCCRWILSVHDRTEGDMLPLTHEFLADMLGVQRSTLSVVARNLQTAGLIRQSRGGITVADRARLETTACECYGRIRRFYERVLPGTYPAVDPARRS